HMNYDNPRYASCPIVCAHCHLASTPVNFSLTLARLPRSTLFPYTTLFRSAFSMMLALALLSSRCMVCCSPSPPNGWAIAARAMTDRKSTRLNSSHVKISYAVFCLKKKIDAVVKIHSDKQLKQVLAND